MKRSLSALLLVALAALAVAVPVVLAKGERQIALRPGKAYPAAKGSTVSFDGVTITGAEDLSGYPTVTAKNAAPATKLEVKDLVVGKGAPATPASTVSVNYVGILYSDGTVFDSSWTRGKRARRSSTTDASATWRRRCSA